MSLPVVRTSNTHASSVYMTDASTAGSAYIAAPCKGYIKKVFVTTQGTAVTVGDNTFTLFIGSSAVTMDALVQSHLTDAAGTVWPANVGPGSTAFCNEGDSIKITSDGAGSSVVPVMISVLFEAH